MPDTTLMRDFIASAASMIENQRKKANCPTTSPRDAHDIQCHVGGAEFILKLARQFLDDAACAAGGKNNGKANEESEKG